MVSASEESPTTEPSRLRRTNSFSSSLNRSNSYNKAARLDLLPIFGLNRHHKMLHASPVAWRNHKIGDKPPDSTSLARRSHAVQPREGGTFPGDVLQHPSHGAGTSSIEHHLTSGGLDRGCRMDQPLSKFVPRAGSNLHLPSTTLRASQA
jgi:hypothetical protein